MMKPGDEQWALLPQNSNSVREGTNLTAGTYYVLVASQGQNLTNGNCNGAGSGWGSGSASYSLSSIAEPLTVLPNTLSYGNDLLFTNAQAGGEMKFYQFNVPAGIASIEVRLENRVGNPVMALNSGLGLVSPYYSFNNDAYGNYGGTNYQWNNGNLITIPNVPPGPYSLSVYGSSVSGNYPDDSYVVRVRAPVVPQLSFSPDFDSGNLTNVTSGVLADNQRAFYQVIVPASVAGAPILGWKLDLTALNGTPSVRVRQNYLPDDNGSDGTSPFNTVTATIVPPYLTPGTWYVEVKGSGSTTYSLTSSVITTNTLKHLLWVMPPIGQTNVASGLALPMIGDSGMDTNGNPLPGDQGIDLEQGEFDYYAVVVPTNNAAVLRTVLQAISGNPNLYLRVGPAPTLAHGVNGNGGTIYDRSLTGGTTEYGNWVPLNGRYETQLTNGIWVIAVQAGGNANVRYRLQLSCGNSVTNGLVQDLALNGGSFTNQNLNGGDWRYYRAQIPDPAPTNWAVTFSRALGSARMFVRDTSPPGDGKNPADFSNAGSNPGPGSSDLQTWNTDGKNQGPYPRFDTPGTYSLTTPPLRPGDVYYLGFWSPVDTTFSVSSSTNGGTINVTNTLAFIGGSIVSNIPGHGTLQYRMDVPASATRILFNASNSVNVVLSLEQGTIALAGGPAHWVSSGANSSLNQSLTTPNNWPWQPGHSYYLAVTNTSAAPENLTFTMSVPSDLMPISVIASSKVISTHPNPTIQVVWGVTNQGPGTASGSWYDRVWFSTNGVLDANSISLGNFGVNKTVPLNGSYWQTNSVTLPMTSNGNYTLFVQVDAGNSIYEANLGDKVSAGVSGTFTLTPPDLMPVSVVAPATVTTTNPNPVVQVAWGVTNQGIGSATGGWYDRVWFSTNGLLDTLSVGRGDFYISQTVAPGGSYRQTNNVTLPISLGGSYAYTLFVQVDINNNLYESNESNNVSAAVPGTLMLDLPPNIVTQPFSQIITPGGAGTFSVVATGTPPLSYLWRLNNAILTGATNATLALNNVQPTNDGAYVVVITNAYGAVTSSVANLLVAAPGTTCASAPSGLIAWLPGEGNALDVVGGHNGTLQNGAGYAPGVAGQGFSFDGASAYVDLGAWSPGTNWTIEAWVNPSATPGRRCTIAGGMNNCMDWAITMDNDQFGVIFRPPGGCTRTLGSSVFASPGTWYHIVGTCDGSTAQIYVNGQFRASGPSDPGYTADASGLRIGGEICCTGNNFPGTVDEVAIYNRALSFEEIATIYLAGANGKCGVPPTMLNQPQSQAVLAGSNAVFNVSAVGEQPLYYQWQQNGVPLVNAGNVSGCTNARLVITNISSSNGGIYSVVVSNAFGSVTSTGAVLAISVVQNGGFESGNLNAWVQSGNTSGTASSSSSTYVHSGNHGLQAGPGGSLGYVSQTIPTLSGQSYLLSFCLNSPDGLTPNEFVVSWNGSTLFDQSNIPAIGWTNMQFIVVATGTDTVLKFGFRNDPSYFGLDDISVSAIPAPMFNTSPTGLHWTSGGLHLQLDNLAGSAVVIYTSTNLLLWTPIFTNPPATGSIQFLDSSATNYLFRYYRAVEQ
jgi:hypothetical protein